MSIDKLDTRQLDLGSAQFFAPEAESPAANQIKILAGWIQREFPNQNIQRPDQNTAAFQAVSGPAIVRWDLVYLNLDGIPIIVQGTEQPSTAIEFTGAPNPPRNNVAYSVALVKVDEDAAVEISQDDITDIRKGHHFTEAILPGEVKMTARTAAPTGWLLMNGDTIGNAASGATHTGEIYRELFGILVGMQPNAGTEVFDSNDTVIVPNLAGRVPVMLNSADTDFQNIGQTGGSKTVNLEHNHAVGNHTHIITDDGGHDHTGLSGNRTDVSGGDDFGNEGTANFVQHGHVITSDGVHNHGGATGISSGNTGNALSPTQTIVQPYFTINYMIKI